MKPEKAQNFENEKSEEVKKDLLSEEDLEKVSGGGYYIIHGLSSFLVGKPTFAH